MSRSGRGRSSTRQGRPYLPIGARGSGAVWSCTRQLPRSLAIHAGSRGVLFVQPFRVGRDAVRVGTDIDDSTGADVCELSDETHDDLLQFLYRRHPGRTRRGEGPGDRGAVPVRAPRTFGDGKFGHSDRRDRCADSGSPRGSRDSRGSFGEKCPAAACPSRGFGSFGPRERVRWVPTKCSMTRSLPKGLMTCGSRRVVVPTVTRRGPGRVRGAR